MQLLISVSVWPFAHKNTHKNTQERDCTHTPADNSRKKSTHKKHTYTHGQINTNSIYLCGYLLSNNTQQLLLCTHSTIITHKHFLYSPCLSRSGVSVCVCVCTCVQSGVKCVVVIETPLRLPSQFYPSMQHSSLCLSAFLSVCPFVCASTVRYITPRKSLSALGSSWETLKANVAADNLLECVVAKQWKKRSHQTEWFHPAVTPPRWAALIICRMKCTVHLWTVIAMNQPCWHRMAHSFQDQTAQCSGSGLWQSMPWTSQTRQILTW